MSNAIARRLEAIQTKGAMRSSDVANVLNVRPETVSRWNKGKALPHASTEKQLLELEFVIDKLADIYEPHDARLWLFARPWHRSTSCSTASICEVRASG